MRTVSLVLLLAALMAANVHAARANLVCRTELADGRILLAEPVIGQDGVFCRRNVFERRHDGFAERREFSSEPLPHMSFTTPTAPFTTGAIGPFTTFSNSPPARATHHR
jgi:hypothetical protein